MDLTSPLRTLIPSLDSAVLEVLAHASVFGSFARRQSTAQSDIDLLLVVGDHAELPQAHWTDGLDALVDAVEEWTGNRLEVLTFTESKVIELSVAGEPIVKAWTDESITVHGPVFSRLLESAGAPA